MYLLRVGGARRHLPPPELVRQPIVGGRNVVFFTSVLLAIPCIWMALALSDGGTSYLQVIIAAGFSGVGGGAFASSMANITPFSPKRQVGYYLGMNGGLGNLGVSLEQLVLPRIMEVGAIDVIVGGRWVFNGGWFMFPLCVESALAAFTWMNNMPRSIHPVPENFGYAILRYLWPRVRASPRSSAPSSSASPPASTPSHPRPPSRPRHHPHRLHRRAPLHLLRRPPLLVMKLLGIMKMKQLGMTTAL